MPIKIKPATGAGSVSLEAQNAISSDFTLTLPGVDGTVNTSGAVNQVPAGSVSAPSIFPTGDTNTGIYFPAADTIGFVEGGVESMRLDSSGNVGIGTTSLSAVSNYRTLTINGTNGALIDLKYGDTLGGRLVGSSGGLSFETGGATPISFYTNNTERARIDSSGNLLVGAATNNNNGKLALTANANNQDMFVLYDTTTSGYGGYYVSFRNSSNALAGYISHTGATSISYINTSDYRLKNDVAKMTGALATVNLLNPVTYKWLADNSDGEGFLAHELQQYVPLAVDGEKDAVNPDGTIKPQGIDYSKLTPLLTAAIQELSAKLDAAEARIAALEAK